MQHGSRTNRSRNATLSLLAIVAAALALVAILPAPASAASSDVRFMRDARSEFDPYLTGADSQTRAWMRRTYWRMRGYAPFFTKNALDWAPPTHVYKDSYAIYNDNKNYPNRPDRSTLAEHPEWALKDSAGRRLYIDFACGGGSCPQYAADIGNPAFRKFWIEQAADALADGYKGLYVDDVNLEWRISNGNGDFVAPIDPRTGEKMTLSAWRMYFAKFLEEIRAAFPTTEITHNALWFAPRTNPQVKRQIRAADFVQLERGFNDTGIVGGTGKFGYRTFLRHIRNLHRAGTSIILKPYSLNRGKAEYELANYFLVRAKRDALMSDYRANPDNFWRGWRTDLGRAKGSWRLWKGLYRRDFQRGMVLVNEPGAPARRVRVRRGLHDLNGKRVRRVTLGSASGKVLTR